MVFNITTELWEISQGMNGDYMASFSFKLCLPLVSLQVKGEQAKPDAYSLEPMLAERVTSYGIWKKI